MLLRALFCLLMTALAVPGVALAAAHPGRKRHPHPNPKPASGGIVNARALAPFLSALGALNQGEPVRVVRILQFGDSHTAADFWSGRVRRRLQDRFGDGGPGWLLPGRPWRGYPHAGVRFLNGQAWPAQSLRSGDCDGWVGLTGSSIRPEPGEDFRVQATFTQCRVALIGPGGAPVTAQCQELPDSGPSLPPAAVQVSLVPPAPLVPLGQPTPMGNGQSLEWFGLKTPAPVQPRELSLTLPAGSSLLGVDLLSGRSGVVYDELGLNGAELTDLERWNPALRRALLAGARPDLIVLAYGSNDMGMAASAQPEYEQRVRALLRTLRQDSGAPILVVGPLDRLGKHKRQRQALAKGANWVIQALTQASLQSDCAFWDARQAMGGYGSVLKWRRAGLAQKDLVHLNGAGYQRLGDQMADALLEAYRTVR